jgi:NADH-quinone oxidoreductase subunit N
MDAALVLPELALTACVFAVFVADLFVPDGRKRLLGRATALLLLGLLVITALQTQTGSVFGGTYVIDTYIHFFRLFFIAASLFIVLFSVDHAAQRLRYNGEYFSLLLMATLAMVLMAGSAELITAYLALELLNFCLYVLSAYNKSDLRSNEAGVKYIVLSVLASALLLMGVSYLYGIAGGTAYGDIARALGSQEWGAGPLLALGFIVAGLGFKVAAVPFHMWTPDVYEGAPTPTTALISVSAKAAGFALLLRLFTGGLLPAAAIWAPLLAVLAAITMTAGNLMALRQRNVKRLLAYSSIGQAGYLLMGLAVPSAFTAEAVLVHMAGYAITGLGVFLCVTAYETLTGADDVDGYAGMAQRAPLLALGLAVGLFSLAGLPLFAGFTTKFYLFTAVSAGGGLWLMALAVVNSLVSLYYYLRVIRQVYIAESPHHDRLVVPRAVSGALIGLTGLTVLVGVYPAPLVAAAGAAAWALGLPR